MFIRKCVPVPFTGTWARIEAVLAMLVVAVFKACLPTALAKDLKPPEAAFFSFPTWSTCCRRAWFPWNFKPGLEVKILANLSTSVKREFIWLYWYP